ncbi:MAG: TrkH family potassium uptake protein [Ruminococcaceae bacterium]|nr:TrkH family potassium uptake protein [Oscillospiraceae bacterium]
MNYRMIGYLLGIVLLIEAGLMLIPATVSLIYGEATMPFLATVAILLAIAIPLTVKKPKNTRIYARDGFITVASAWILLSAFGALPFVIGGAIPNYIDAFFETVSGFTTTGSTILREVESLPRGILFWRSFTHWVGGMGVLVFMLAILPSDNGRAMYLLRAEVPGVTKGKLVPKMRQSALILYGIYVVLTVIEAICLLCTGMPLYDSLVNAFATAGTGGFSVKDGSIGAYGNPAAEWVVAVFMLIFGINFNIYFLLLVKRFKDILKSEELRIYIIICTVATAVIAANICTSISGLGVADSIRAAFFQVTAIISTTGFSTADFNLWPSLSKTVLLIFMFLGACTGSTSGGLKISRVILVIKNAFRSVRKTISPRSVSVVRLEGEVLSEDTVKSASNHITVYLSILMISTMLISIDGFDFETNFTAVLSCISNIGPGFGAVGPMGSFADYSYFSKLLLSLVMLAGRLEFIPILVLFSPSAWKKH